MKIVNCKLKIDGFDLNKSKPSVLHLDLNSAFASAEQQANPLLRGVPLVVAAYNKPFGCILASSKEAKLWGVKTGMTVGDGQKLCPFLVVREADPHKYRHIHDEIRKVLDTYSDAVIPKSIDEFVLDLSHLPTRTVLVGAAQQIQQEIKSRVGDWLTVSVGIGPNRFLAKLGSDLKGVEPVIIDHTNLESTYASLTLPDLSGISWRLTRRLREQGIFTPLAFLRADLTTLKAAFRSVLARDWYLRLRGWEVDDLPAGRQAGSNRKSFGQSYVLPRPLPPSGWLPILAKLVDKAARRLRLQGYAAHGAHLLLHFHNHTFFHRGRTQINPLFSTSDLLALTHSLIPQSTPPVKHLAVTFFDLSPLHVYQCSLFKNIPRLHALTQAVDSVNERFGAYTLHTASMLNTDQYVPDRIAFGK